MNCTRKLALTGVAMMALWAMPITAQAADADAAGMAAPADGEIVVTDVRASTKTDTPPIQIPQPVTVIPAERYLSQGAINISDTIKYTAGALPNAYGRDTRVDGFVVRGIDALQFRDGMRDIYSYYASITADPYNFSQIEIVRGPASVLFGQGSIGGLVNLVSKTPDFVTRGELKATYGSYDRKEVLGDVNVALADNVAVRLVGRARDAETYVDHVPDDRVMLAPSIRWQPTPDTDVVLTGLYQKDKTGSTSQFLPIIGTFRPNPNSDERLDPFTFVGKPGSDRYEGRLLQGGGSITHRFSDNVKLSLKARYIDSHLDYFTHYADSYSNPTNPFLDPAGRTIGLYSDASIARMKVFSTDNNLQFDFNTGTNIAHKLLVGIDYAWNRVSKRSGFGYEVIDLYNINYDAVTVPIIGTTPTVTGQKQLGVYVQDQIRLYDAVSVVLGTRHDRVNNRGGGIDKATTFRAGIIGEIGAGLAPFFSYTESFLPVSGINTITGNLLVPQRGRQFEAGLKWQPDAATMVTITGYKIKERNRVLYGAGNSVYQSGVLNTKGFEVEASRSLPENFEILANYGYNHTRATDVLDYLPSHTASVWTTKTFGDVDAARLRLGAGVVYAGKRRSEGAAWTIVTPSYTTVDALAEITWDKYSFTVNATNLLDKRYFASCLARGDCFVGAPRNVMGTLGVRF